MKPLAMRSFLITVFLSISQFLFLNSHGQTKSTELGGKWINEMFNKFYGFGLGGQLVHHLDRHSALETGLYFKENPRTDRVMFGPNLAFVKYKDFTLMTPLLYRFNTRLINLSAGGTISYFLNYKQTERYTDHTTGRFEFGATVSLSKSFSLGKNWILEPELRCSSPIPDGGVGTALNLALRKRLKK